MSTVVEADVSEMLPLCDGEQYTESLSGIGSHYFQNLYYKLKE